MPESKIQWHPKFATALQLELEDYLQTLDIREEHQLTSKPLQIDILIIKKPKDVKIMKNIAQIFKGYNIIEYKSPTDYISIKDYYKVKAYAYLYTTLGESMEDREIEDITITMVSNHFPEKMVQHITKVQNVKVTEQSQGIYYIEGSDIASQIIVINELPAHENVNVRILTQGLDIKYEISVLLKKFAANPKDSRYEMMMDAVLQTNLLQLKEVYQMAKVLNRDELEALQWMVSTFNLDKKWFDKGKDEGKDEGKIEEVVSILLRQLSKKFKAVPQSLINKIRSINNPVVLEAIADDIFDIQSLDEVEEYLKR